MFHILAPIAQKGIAIYQIAHGFVVCFVGIFPLYSKHWSWYSLVPESLLVPSLVLAEAYLLVTFGTGARVLLDLGHSPKVQSSTVYGSFAISREHVCHFLFIRVPFRVTI